MKSFLISKKIFRTTKKQTKLLTKDYLKDKEGMLLPFIFVFLELCLRSQNKHKYALSIEMKVLTEIKSLNQIDVEAEYLRILSIFQEKPYFKELVENESIFYVSPELNLNHKQQEKTKGSFSQKIVSPEVKTAYVPQKFLIDKQLYSKTKDNNHQTKEESARDIINQRIKRDKNKFPKTIPSNQRSLL